MGKFKLDYVPETELSAGFNLLEPGEATFVIKNVYYNDKEGFPLTSKEGAPKVVVVVEATDCKGVSSSIYEHITAKAAFKSYTMCKAVGRKELYEESGVDFDLLKGAKGKCMVKTDQSPGYNASSKIYSYIPHPKYADEEDKVDMQKGVDQNAIPDDTCPF
jgi:hypothetical protein